MEFVFCFRCSVVVIVLIYFSLPFCLPVGPIVQVEVTPTGSLSLDHVLGVGGLPKGRVVEVRGERGGVPRRARQYIPGSVLQPGPSSTKLLIVLIVHTK